ncbi:GAP family protein [Candidatus Woesearchaeota archaeon]|nr:GAP family protein [Candidatus Woesearchaeota archaeon]
MDGAIKREEIGGLMMVLEVSLPTLGAVLGTAVIDAVNPCAIGTLILLISTIIVAGRQKEMLKIGLIYIFAVFLTYFLFGLGLITFMAAIPQVVAEYISIGVGLLIVLAGLVEIKDYFWYGKGFSLMIPHQYVHVMEKKMKNISTKACILLGVFVATVELPCTGGPYLAVTLLLAQNFNMTAFLLLLAYNLIFILPLVVILFLVRFGIRLPAIQAWKQRNKATMRLITGCVLIALGWLLMLIANGTINLG